MKWPEFKLCLPAWIEDYCSTLEDAYHDVESRMQVAIALSRMNVAEGSGGPFGAAIFEQRTGRFVAPGVNLVVKRASSLAHAEVVAIMTAQTLLGTYALNQAAGAPYQLVSSTEPCAMCMGAIPWSGLSSLVCGASDADARAVGFEEGDKPGDWRAGYARRGIDVTCHICAEDAAQVLRDYAEAGGKIYNSKASQR
ncbi:MAG: nucleoside deaminase [Verrucomicrobia bacterium]|nr:nucleoside deaminase [Verrucomicrobiota bacterium]